MAVALKSYGVLEVLERFPSGFRVIISEPVDFEGEVLLTSGGASVVGDKVDDIFSLVAGGDIERGQAFGVCRMEIFTKPVGMELEDLAGGYVLAHVGVGLFGTVTYSVFNEEGASVTRE